MQNIENLKQIGKTTGDFYTALAMKESTNNPVAINGGNYIGLYQFGEATLADTGYYKKELKPRAKPRYSLQRQ